jgi:hypothetical protein
VSVAELDFAYWTARIGAKLDGHERSGKRHESDPVRELMLLEQLLRGAGAKPAPRSASAAVPTGSIPKGAAMDMQRPPRGGSRDAFGVIIPTFRRNEALVATLLRLAEQTATPDEVVVVDNANSLACRARCQDVAAAVPYVLTYIASPVNGGPAGASNIGIRHFLNRETVVDWIARGDDDSPVVRSDLFECLLEAAHRALKETPELAGIGVSGAVYSRRTGLLSKPPRSPSGQVQVDYLATNYYPIFSRDAVGVVGGFRDELFLVMMKLTSGFACARRDMYS